MMPFVDGFSLDHARKDIALPPCDRAVRHHNQKHCMDCKGPEKTKKDRILMSSPTQLQQ